MKFNELGEKVKCMMSILFSLSLRRKSVRNEYTSIIVDDEYEGIGETLSTSRMTGEMPEIEARNGAIAP